MFIMVWVDDVERFVGWLCMFMYLMDGLAPNLSKYDSKLLPSVKYDWNIASKLGADNAGVVFLMMKSLDVGTFKVICSRDFMKNQIW